MAMKGRMWIPPHPRPLSPKGARGVRHSLRESLTGSLIDEELVDGTPAGFRALDEIVMTPIDLVEI